MARKNISFTRYFYKVLIRGGGGGGGRGDWQVHQKAQAYNSGSVGQDVLPGPLHLLVQIVAIPPKILKWPEKKKPNFYSPPPTHIPAQAQYTKDWSLKNVITPIILNTKFAPPPLIPPQKYIRPPTPYPLPLCVLYHNIDSSDQWRVQGDSGGRFELKLFHFHKEFSENLSGKVNKSPPPPLLKIWTPIKKSRIRTCWSA